MLPSGLGGMGSAQPVAIRMVGAVGLVVEADPAKLERSAGRGDIQPVANLDDAIAALWAKMQHEFHDRTAGLIADLGELRPGLSPGDAIDIAWVLTSVRTYLMLVHDRGWSTQRYETWLFEALRRELLG